MDTAAYLTRQGWLGPGHSLYPAGHGIAKPLLISKKDDLLGLGNRKTDNLSNQWWLNAFDNTLKQLSVGTEEATTTVADKVQLALGLQRTRFNTNPLYRNFIQGEGLSGTQQNASIDKQTKMTGSHQDTVALGTGDQVLKKEKKQKKKRMADQLAESSGDGGNGTQPNPPSEELLTIAGSNQNPHDLGNDDGMVKIETKQRKRRKAEQLAEGFGEGGNGMQQNPPSEESPKIVSLSQASHGSGSDDGALKKEKRQRKKRKADQLAESSLSLPKDPVVLADSEKGALENETPKDSQQKRRKTKTAEKSESPQPSKEQAVDRVEEASKENEGPEDSVGAENAAVANPTPEDSEHRRKKIMTAESSDAAQSSATDKPEGALKEAEGPKDLVGPDNVALGNGTPKDSKRKRRRSKNAQNFKEPQPSGEQAIYKAEATSKEVEGPKDSAGPALGNGTPKDSRRKRRRTRQGRTIEGPKSGGDGALEELSKDVEGPESSVFGVLDSVDEEPNEIKKALRDLHKQEEQSKKDIQLLITATEGDIPGNGTPKGRRKTRRRRTRKPGGTEGAKDLANPETPKDSHQKQAITENAPTVEGPESSGVGLEEGSKEVEGAVQMPGTATDRESTRQGRRGPRRREAKANGTVTENDVAKEENRSERRQ